MTLLTQSTNTSQKEPSIVKGYIRLATKLLRESSGMARGGPGVREDEPGGPAGVWSREMQGARVTRTLVWKRANQCPPDSQPEDPNLTTLTRPVLGACASPRRCFNSDVDVAFKDAQAPSYTRVRPPEHHCSTLSSQRAPRAVLPKRPPGRPGARGGVRTAPPPAAVVPQDGTRGTCSQVPTSSRLSAGAGPRLARRPVGGRRRDRAAQPRADRTSPDRGLWRGAVGARGPGRLPACCAGSRSC